MFENVKIPIDHHAIFLFLLLQKQKIIKKNMTTNKLA